MNKKRPDPIKGDPDAEDVSGEKMLEKKSVCIVFNNLSSILNLQKIENIFSYQPFDCQ